MTRAQVILPGEGSLRPRACTV
jgi:hypothetical protein